MEFYRQEIDNHANLTVTRGLEESENQTRGFLHHGDIGIHQEVVPDASWINDVRRGVREIREKQSKGKEADRIPARELPTVRTKDAWLPSLKTQVVVASGRRDDAVATRWLDMVCDTTKAWDDLMESGKQLTTVDVQFATALSAFFKDDKTQVNNASQIMLLPIDDQRKKAGRVTRGRHVLNALWHDLTSGIYVATVIARQTLASVELSGDHLSDLSFRWCKMLAAARVRPGVDSLT